MNLGFSANEQWNSSPSESFGGTGSKLVEWVLGDVHLSNLVQRGGREVALITVFYNNMYILYY